MIIANYKERKEKLLRLNIETLKSLADQGSAIAQTVTAVRYRDGIGVEKDPLLGFDYFLKAANQGFDVAQASVGVCYAQGEGTRRDVREAGFWLRQAAQQGNEFANKWIRYIAAQRALGNPNYIFLSPA